MRLWLVSDTHWPTRGMYDLKGYINNFSNVEYVFHMGDFDVYSTYMYFKDYFEDKFIGVYGNCDDLNIKRELPEEKIVNINGFKILVFHSHSIYPRGDEFKLLEKALENNVNIVFYGHTHIKKVHYFDLEKNEIGYIKISNNVISLTRVDLTNKVYFLNPGSLLDSNYLVVDIF